MTCWEPLSTDAGGGADLIDGGKGFDTLQLKGVRADYDLDIVEGSYVLRHVRGDRYDGTKTFANVEALKFADRPVSPVDDFML